VVSGRKKGYIFLDGGHQRFAAREKGERTTFIEKMEMFVTILWSLVVILISVCMNDLSKVAGEGRGG
jgi:hypothetical protein